MTNAKILKLLIFGKPKQTFQMKLRNGLKNKTNVSKVRPAKNGHLNLPNNRPHNNQPNPFFKPNTILLLWNHNYFQNIIILKFQQVNYEFFFTRIEILVRVNYIFVPFFFLSIIDNILLFSVFTKFCTEKVFI